MFGVARRNERERRRVRLVNAGFARLRQSVPGARPGKRLSKVETLRAAIRYIRHLRQLLTQPLDKAWEQPQTSRWFEEETVPYCNAPLQYDGAPWAPYVWAPSGSDFTLQFEDRVETMPPAYVPEYVY